MEFLGGGCFSGIFKIWAIERDTYTHPPKGVGEDNAAWELLKPLYGLSTSRKDRYGAIRKLLSWDFGGRVTSLNKSVCYWDRQDFDYEYGEGFRDKNVRNLDRGILRRMSSLKQRGEEMRLD